MPRAFLERARREADRYGDDPWILLRELVQNSRDAGASEIAFSLTRADGEVRLTCTDNGSGMTRADMGNYLLRLYASGKAPSAGETADQRADGPVGRFGVGFWSVLRFGPSRVVVESRRDGETTAFCVDCEASVIRDVPCTLTEDGTRVTLARADDEDDQLALRVREKLRMWCGPVTGLRGRRPPRLTLDGMPLNGELAMPELIGERVRGRGFSGVIGLDRRPQVRLYSHGLLVRDVGSLEELLPRRARGREVSAPGLHPVVRINADGLEVLMNRQAVVEDRLLFDIVGTAERRLLALRRRLLDRLAPLRVLDRLRVAWPQVSGLAALYAVAVLGGAAFVATLPAPAVTAIAPVRAAVTLPSPDDAAAPRPLPAGHLGDEGPRINQPRSLLGDTRAWDVRVRGAGTHLLKIATHAAYDDARGLVPERPRAVGWYDVVPDGRNALAIDATVAADGRWAPLPIPAGYGVVADSVRVAGKPVRPRRGAFGEPLIENPRGQRVVYRVRERVGPRALHPEVGTHPRPFLPWAKGPPQRRVERVARYVPSVIDYSTSPADAVRLDEADGDFVTRVATVKRGDCDVMNAYAALLLRSLEVPAHLAVGIVVEDGEVAVDLHAWTEYWDGARWRAVDVSPPLELPTPGAPGVTDSAPTAARGDAPAARPMPAATTSAGAPSAAAPPTDAPTPSRAPSVQRLRDAFARALPVLSPSEQRWLLFGAGALGGALLLTLVLLLVLRPRGQRLDDVTLARLLEHHLKSPRGGDPLHLNHRPFFRTLTGKHLSLADLERLAAAGKLFAAKPGDRLLRYLKPRAPILDRSSPRLEGLLRHLPQLTRLEDLRAIVERSRDPAVAALEQRLREIDDGVRVHVAAGRDDVREVALPVPDNGLAPRHIVVGEDFPALVELRELYAEQPAVSTFRLLREVLDRTTLYRAQRDALLARAAREALA